jgi:hypothetical protein
VPLAGGLAYGGYVRSHEPARAEASPADSSEPQVL